VASITDIINTSVSANQTNGLNGIALISQQLVARINSERREVAVDYNRPDYVAAQTQQQQLLKFKSGIADNLSALGKASSAIGWVDSTLQDTLVQLQEAQQSSDPEVRAQAAADFNDALNTINSRVDGANQTVNYQNVNLVGNPGLDFGVSKLYVTTDMNGGGTYVQGQYLGTRYNIDATDGSIWRYDQGSNNYIQYSGDGTGTPTGQTLSADNMEIVGYDSDSGAAALSSDQGTIVGTVDKGGLGLLPSGFYNDFQDDDSIQRAIDDVNSAIAYETSRGASMKATDAVVEASNNMAQQKINRLNNDISNITQQELSTTEAQNRAATLKASLAVNNINLVAQQHTGLVQNLLDSINGQGPAFGVFGVMGF
jgi:hypothetical protein